MNSRKGKRRIPAATPALAAAALLIETARADFTQDAANRTALENRCCSSLKLDKRRYTNLSWQLKNRVDESTSLYEFTRVINDYYSASKNYS